MEFLPQDLPKKYGRYVQFKKSPKHELPNKYSTSGDAGNIYGYHQKYATTKVATPVGRKASDIYY